MRTRTFGNSGLETTVIGYGGWPMGRGMYGALDDDEAMKAARAAYDGGVTLFDTAAIYGLGVGLAALTVLVVQGGIALAAGALEGVLTDPMIDALASAGGILLIGIALRLLELKHLRVANMLPALAIAPLLVWIFP